MKARREIRKINELCKTEEELKKLKLELSHPINLDQASHRLNCVSNCPQLTLSGIHKALGGRENIFVKMSALNDEKLFPRLSKTSKLAIVPRIVIDCEGEAIENVEACAAKLQRLRQRVIFVSQHRLSGDVVNQEFAHAWADLSTRTKENLMETKLSFQGISVRFDEIFSGPSDRFLQSIPLNTLLQCRWFKNWCGNKFSWR